MMDEHIFRLFRWVMIVIIVGIVSIIAYYTAHDFALLSCMDRGLPVGACRALLQ